ncbi:hypothetical protein QTP88_011575 [Uroleucon formosanum]
MKHIKKILILLVITYSVLAAPKNGEFRQRMTEEDIRNRNHIQDSLNGLLCPPVGLTHKFEVFAIQTETPMYGCAYMEKATLPRLVPLFHLWLERPERTMVHGHCNDMENMDHFIFECLSNDNPTNKASADKDWKYVSLLEHTSPYSMKNETKSVLFRCAVYDVQNYDLDGVRIIRIAISKASDKRLPDYVQQCKGPGNLLGEDALPYVPEGQREWPDGSLYLYLIGKKPFTPT